MHRRFDNSTPILLQTAFTDSLTNVSWNKLLSGGGKLEYLIVLAVFREYIYATSTRNIYGFNTLDTLSTPPTISDVCTVGTACCTRGSALLIMLLVLAVFGPSVLVLLILPPRAVSRTPLTTVLGSTRITDP